jgi:hypothetical protein
LKEKLLSVMASAWDELGSIQGKCLQLSSELSIALQEDVLGVPTERFTSCSDFQTKATVKCQHNAEVNIPANGCVLRFCPGWNHD